MTVEIISWSISMKVWDRARIELASPGSAVRLASVARHVTDCATRPGVQKSKKHFKILLRQTVTNAQLSFVFTRTRKSLNQSITCFSNLHRHNYCTVNKDAVAVRRSDWPRAKSDDAYCKRTMTNPAAIFWSFVAEAKFGLPLLSSGVFKEFETRQQKKKLA